MEMRQTKGMPKATTTRMPARRLSVEQAAPILGVSVYMVRSLIRQRRVPYYRVGRRIVLDPGDLEQFLQTHRVEARTKPIDHPRRTALTRAADIDRNSVAAAPRLWRFEP
jgi:excisionase family DNA binding protein